MDTQPTRPKSVTVIAWIIIVIGSLGLLGVIAGLLNPASLKALEGARVPVGVAMLFGLVVNIVNLVCGANMLKGMNWSRWLWLLFNPFSFIATLIIYGLDSQVTNPLTLIFTPVLYITALIILASKSASIFFRH